MEERIGMHTAKCRRLGGCNEPGGVESDGEVEDYDSSEDNSVGFLSLFEDSGYFAKDRQPKEQPAHSVRQRSSHSESMSFLSSFDSGLVCASVARRTASVRMRTSFSMDISAALKQDESIDNTCTEMFCLENLTKRLSVNESPQFCSDLSHSEDHMLEGKGAAHSDVNNRMKEIFSSNSSNTSSKSTRSTHSPPCKTIRHANWVPVGANSAFGRSVDDSKLTKAWDAAPITPYMNEFMSSSSFDQDTEDVGDRARAHSIPEFHDPPYYCPAKRSASPPLRAPFFDDPSKRCVDFGTRPSQQLKGEDLPWSDVPTLRYFFNLGCEYHRSISSKAFHAQNTTSLSQRHCPPAAAVPSSRRRPRASTGIPQDPAMIEATLPPQGRMFLQNSCDILSPAKAHTH